MKQLKTFFSTGKEMNGAGHGAGYRSDDGFESTDLLGNVISSADTPYHQHPRNEENDYFVPQVSVPPLDEDKTLSSKSSEKSKRKQGKKRKREDDGSWSDSKEGAPKPVGRNSHFLHSEDV